MPANPMFKSPEHEARYRAAYEAVLALWPVPYEAVDVETRFGTTHLNICGPADAPPLILLHGFGVSSVQWYPNVGPLSARFRVYAVDVINALGLSILTRHLKSYRDSADWLLDVMDGLDIARAAIGRLSYGGWLALNLGIQEPQRVDKLILISPPAAFARLRWQLFLRMSMGMLFPVRRAFYWIFNWLTTRRCP